MKKNSQGSLIVDPFADIRERAAARKTEDERKFPPLPKPKPTKNQRKRARQKAKGKRRSRSARGKEARITLDDIAAAILTHENRLHEVLQHEGGLEYPGGQRMFEMDRDYHLDEIERLRAMRDEMG